MSDVRFCPRCATPLETQADDYRLRQVCPACGWVHYPQPKVCAAAIIMQSEQVLLIRRVREPYAGAWGLPAGYVEGDETPDQAAAREVKEENGLTVTIGPLLGVYPFADDPRGPGLLFTYLARLMATDEGRKTMDKGTIEASSVVLRLSSSEEGEPRWWPIDGLPDELVGAGQAPALLAW